MTDTIIILDQASGYLQLDMLEAFKAKYKKRVIVAGTIVERSTKLSKEVIWHRVRPYNRTTFLKRYLTWTVCTVQMAYYVLKYRKAKVLAITNPPFSPFIPLFFKVNYDVLIYDLYPEALVNYNYLSETNMVVRIWEYMNRKMFRSARRIFTLSEGMKSKLERYVNPEKITIAPIWTDNKYLKAVDRDYNKFLEGKDFKDKFLIVYSGNFGRTHPIEVMVTLARKLDPNRFHLVLIGGGHKWKLMTKLISESQLDNLTLLPWQPVEMLPHTLSAANISVVTLDSEASQLSVPSKTYNIMSVAKPILAVASEDSELANLIKHYDIGISCKVDQIETMTSFIERAYKDKDYYNALCENSLNASYNFTSENAKIFL